MHTRRQIRGALARVLLITLIAVIAPLPVMSVLGFASTGGFVGLAGLAAVVATLSIGVRGGLIAAVALGAGATLLTLSSGYWWLAAFVMAVFALGLGLSARRGWQSAFLWVPIALGFVASDAAKTLQGLEFAALVLGVSFLIWGAGVAGLAHLVFRRPIMPQSHGESPRVVAGYAFTITVVTFITQGAAVGLDLGHAGSWLVMTPLIVVQPHMRDGWRKALLRAGGTVVGFGIVMGVAAVVTTTSILYVIAILAFNAAMYVKLRSWNYFVYAALLTPAIVILEGTSSSLTQTAEYRLEATLGGVAISLIAMALLGLLARSYPASDDD